jgi:hypothetical protein
MSLRAGDWVEVRSREEILATLDRSGCLGKLPFMPQMFSYCGQRFRVLKSAHKSCDTVSSRYTGLTVEDTVHLEHRCDGVAFGGCQAGCLLFWKEAWLKPIDVRSPGGTSPLTGAAAVTALGPGGRCTENDVLAATRTVAPDGETIHSCQATRLLEYAKPLKWWDARQYVETYRTGNTTLRELLSGLTYLAFTYGTGAHRDGWGRPFRWLYDLARPLHRGGPFPRRSGTLPLGTRAPRHDLGLQPGELVRVKPFEEILKTVDKAGSNRGLAFDAELVPYCGKTFRVLARVERFVDERTGRMRALKTPAVILDGVVCRARYAGQRMFCPRAIHLWWREIWLCRLKESQAREHDAA